MFSAAFVSLLLAATGAQAVDCASEIEAWYQVLTDLCDGGTVTSTNGTATTTATAESSDCLCDSDYRLVVKQCLYQTSGCSGDVSSWYSYLDKTTCPSTDAAAAAATPTSSGSTSSQVTATGSVAAAAASTSSTSTSGASQLLAPFVALALAAMGGATLL
ncbi:hypothetical protein MNV49_003847 [Pseudohyphozyma bogoriensis]|nr:hypothetical protein MNV49_003847 [Pseudohyphozyma bogoriensis]